MIYNEIESITTKLDYIEEQLEKHKIAKLSLQNQITEINQK